MSSHDDENTGAEAAMEFIRENGGSLVELQYGNERNIKFNLKSSLDKCIFDPNGMFTDTGAYRTLDKHASVTSEAVQAIRSLGKKYWKPIIMITWGTSLLCITTRKDYIPSATICLDN